MLLYRAPIHHVSTYEKNFVPTWRKRPARTLCGMMRSMEKVTPEKSSESFTCQLFSSVVSR